MLNTVVKVCESSEEGVIDSTPRTGQHLQWEVAHVLPSSRLDRALYVLHLLFTLRSPSNSPGLRLLPPLLSESFYARSQFLIIESHDCNPGNMLESFGKAVPTLDILNILGSLPGRGSEAPSETV